MRYALAGVLALVAADGRAAPTPRPEPGAVRLGSATFRSPASAVVLSPDGKSAALRVPGGIDVMSLDTGEVTARLRDDKKLAKPKDNPGPSDVTFAFAAGGKELVTCSATDEVWVWDAATGKPLRPVPGPRLPNHNLRRVYGVYNCQLADFLVAETVAGMHKLDAKTGAWTYFDSNYNRLADVSADGRWVTQFTDMASVENYVGVVDTKAGKSVYAGVSGGSYPFNSTPAPDGKLVACTTDEAGPQVWTVPAGKEVKLKGVAPKVSHGGPGFTPDGKVLLVPMPGSVYDEKTPPHFARWDVTTGERLPDWRLPARIGPWAVDHANNRLVVVAGQCVFRIDLATGELIPPPDGFVGYARPAISPDGKLAAVGDSVGVVRVYEAPFDGKPRTLRAGGSAVDDLVFSKDGRTLFAGYSDRSVGVWDVAAGKGTATLKAPVGPAADLSWYRTLNLALSPDGKTLAGEANLHAVWAWDVATGKLLWEERAGKGGAGIPGCRPVFSPDGATLYYGRDGGEVSRFDPRTGKERKRLVVPELMPRPVTRLAVSADGGKLAASTYANDGDLAVVDLATGTATAAKAFRREDAVGGLAFSADGTAVLTTHPDGTVRARRADDLSTEEFVLRGPAGYVSRLRLSADGTRAVTDAPGATALVWRLK